MLSGGVYPLVSEEPDGELQLKSPKNSTDIAFLYLRPWPKNDGLLTDFLFDLHHFAASGSKKQKCLRTGILRRKRQKKWYTRRDSNS